MPQENAEELITLNMHYKVPYRWPNGESVALFLKELKDNEKIYASKCPKCGRFQCPPLVMCGRCHVRMGGREKWIEVGPGGSVISYNVVEQSFWHPVNDGMLPVPVATAIIHLDGAPVTIYHQLEETNPEKLRVGLRVEAVFKPKEERRGNFRDLQFFRIID